MIQYTITINTAIDAVREATEVIKGGCQWIELQQGDLDDETFTRLAMPVIDLCRNEGIILVFQHNHLLLEKLRVHGVLLSAIGTDPVALREKLGGHPIIGYEVAPGEEVDFMKLKRADADYLVYPSTEPATIKLLADSRDKAGFTFPVVARGMFNAENIKPVINAGAQAINIDYRSLDTKDIEASFKSLLEIIQQ